MAAGQGGLAVGTINIFAMFAQSAMPISRQVRIREFQTRVEDWTAHFVGREFIFRAIDEALADPTFPSGYIVIRGEPGIGKTSLIAKLVKERGYVHHFNIASENIRSVGGFLTNLCAQLIVRYSLDYETLPANVTNDSGFLSQLLIEATAHEPSEPVVVLVDALDEAEKADLNPRANCLYLPQVVPAGVYFIVTTREQYDFRLVVDSRRPDIYLLDNDPANLNDVRMFIRNFIADNSDEMAIQIDRWGIMEDEFIEVLTERSQGNFMYLVHVLRDIRSGRLTSANVSTIRSLPSGLRAYYQDHWRAMGASVDKPSREVLCLLAAALEPATRAQIAEWAQVSPEIVAQAIRDWYEFLHDTQGIGEERLYALYHASFRDFLSDEVGLRPYHHAIARDALSKIPGFLEQPP